MSTTVRRYASVVNPQVNPNLTKRINWSKIGNAVGGTQEYATSSYENKYGKNKKVTSYNYPYKITAHNFNFSIPKNAYIKEIRVGVRLRAGVGGVSFPSCGFYIKDSKSNVTDTNKSGTGWHNGIYWSSTSKEMTKSWHTHEYVMSDATYKKGGFTVDQLNSNYFGVDLNFADKSSKDQYINLKWVWVEITYDVPTYSLTHSGINTTSSAPHIGNTNVELKTTFTLSQTKEVSDLEHTYHLKVPYGVKVSKVYASKSGSVSYSTVAGSGNDRDWTVKFNGVGKATLTVEYVDYTENLEHIDVYLTSKLIKKEVNGYYRTISKYYYVLEDNPSYAYEGATSKSFWFLSRRGNVDGYNDIIVSRISSDEPHKRHKSCFAVTTKNMSLDDSLDYRVRNDKPFDIVLFDDGLPFQLDDLSDSRISIVSTNITEFERNDDGTYSIPADTSVIVSYNVPPNYEIFDLAFTVCIRPKVDGVNNLTVLTNDSKDPLSETLEYTVLPSYEYHIGSKLNDDTENQHEGLSTEIINFANHRIASELETGAFVLPCTVKDGDAVMIQSNPNIHMYKWEELDYIGCVPLEHLHFDPKSTYKDKLLDNHYKNKRYMGKQLASDEDISLNVRLHPRQVTTIQGLIDMDKPIPINANHKCFEGDSLNHRGWAEIYAITTTLTNPHWYKCEIDVKYLTHNLNTRFNITRGDKTFGKYSIPSLLAEINSSGDSLSQNEQSAFFIIDTDGTYAYDEDDGDWEDYLDENGEPVKWIGDNTTLTVTDIDDEGQEYSVTYTGEEVPVYIQTEGYTVETPVLNQNIRVYEEYTVQSDLKNIFTLDEGQHLSIKSKNALSTINQISISWSSSKLSENKENNIKRITRLIDVDTDDVVFEYEYCDFDFANYEQYTSVVDEYTTGLLNCRVIGRKKNQSDYDIVFDEVITLATDVETTEGVTDETDEDDNLISDLKYFGSTLHFQLNNNVLAVIDEGYNGKEVTRENIELEGKQYKWETYWINNNTDGENQDISSFIDIVVQDSVLESKYADKYSSMYVSPFPVNGKDILFTRNAEEGVLYYLKDNNEEFTYLIEPYYQYHNGVDLRASVDDGTGDYISIFNLNYGYKVIYLENGLVSLGINRLNGKMYLRKYDPILKEYISLFNLQLSKYDDININSISDDRIELQASDTTIIMYRGHPYVIFKHELEEIGIDTKSYKVWGQRVDGEESQYPVMFDLMNHDNLLPMCVTGKLDDDCVSLEEHTIPDSSLTVTDIELEDVLGDVYVNDEITFNVKIKDTNIPFTEKVCYLVRKDDIDGYDEVGCSSTGSFNYKVNEQGAYHVIAVYTGDDTHKYSISNEISITVGVPAETVQPTTEDAPSGELTPKQQGNYALSMNVKSTTLRYYDNEPITFTLTYSGKPASGKVIEIVDFTRMNTATTNANGQVTIRNNKNTNKPKKWRIGARFWNGGNKVVKQVFKDITIKKATPNITLKHGAKKKNGYFSVNLSCDYGNGRKINLKNKKIIITVGGKKYERKTNSNGNVSLKVTDTGIHKYKCTFAGDTGFNKATFNYRENVLNG